MRNLKRVLSLALASVMLMGMMVMGAGAADTKKTAGDLTDMDKVSNKEAVTLLVDLGIVEGKTDSSFAPAETVNRATMAKLITIMMMGDVDQDMFKGTTTDLTDVNGHWAEGYIKYCYSNKIIVGDGAGHFMPDEPVTTVAAAKMLLVATGYNAADRKYENDSNWSINIMRDAQSTKLYDGKTVRALTKGLSLKATDSLSRDNAAQMIFNTLFVATQKANPTWDNGQQYIQGYTAQPSLADTTYGGLTRATATLSTTDAGKISTYTMLSGIKDDDGALISTVTGLTKLSASSVDAGKTIAFYVDSSNKLISSAIVVTTGTGAGYVVPQGLSNGTASKAGSALKFLKDNNLTATTKIEDIATINVFDKTGASAPVAPFATPANDADALSLAIQNIVKGDQVTLYDTNKDNIVDTITVIHKAVAKLSADPSVKYDKTSEVDKVTIKGTNININGVDIANVSGYQDLVKDDVVLYYQDGDGNFYLEKAEIVTGKVTGSKAGDVRFNGEYVGPTGLVANSSTNAAGSSVAKYLSDNVFNVDATAYLDNNGNIIAIDNDTETASNYGVVLKTAWVSEQGVDAAANRLESKMVYADGTTETVTIPKIDGYNVKKTGTQYDGEPVADGYHKTAANNLEYYGVSDSNTGAKNIDSTIFKYLVKDSKTQLTAVTGTALASGTVSKGVAALGTIGDITTDTTTFVYHTKSNDKDVYTVYTGYKNAPTTTNTKIATAVSSSRVAFAYVDATGSSATSGETNDKNYLYVLDTAVAVRYEGDDTFYDITGVLNGDTEETTISVDSNTIANLFTGGSANLGLFQVTLDENNVVTGSATKVTKTGNWVAVAGTDTANGDAAGGVLVVKGTNVGTYTYDGAEKVYLVDTSDKTLVEGSISDVTDGMHVFIEVVDAGATGASKTLIKTIYVVED